MFALTVSDQVYTNGMTIMKNFVFNTAKSIVFEAGANARIAEIVGLTLGPRVVLVTDRGLRRLGLIDPRWHRSRKPELRSLFSMTSLSTHQNATSRISRPSSRRGAQPA